MKAPKCKGLSPTSPPRRRKPRFCLRRRKKDRAVRGKLRMRSVPGAFLVLGVMVVAVGTALAVAGYWPYHLSRLSAGADAEGENMGDSQMSDWSLGSKGLFSTAGLLHGDRMKLLGPVIMGVGLFILICANTVLYENRDRETQMLLAQMRNVICSVSAAVPSAGLRDLAAANSMAKHCQWVSSLPAAHLNILWLQQLANSEPLLQTSRSRDKQGSVEGFYQQALLRTEALHHQESASPTSGPSSSRDSSDTCQTKCDAQTGAEQEGEAGPAPQTPPLLRFNVCLASATSMSNLGVGEAVIRAVEHRRCYSMSSRTGSAQPLLCSEQRLLTVEKDQERSLLQSSSGDTEVRLDVLDEMAEVTKEQAHQSWPRLDLGGGRRYLKLDNKEDSVDKLLDQLEQQYSSWDKTFGSGPFQ